MSERSARFCPISLASLVSLASLASRAAARFRCWSVSFHKIVCARDVVFAREYLSASVTLPSTATLIFVYVSLLCSCAGSNRVFVQCLNDACSDGGGCREGYTGLPASYFCTQRIFDLQSHTRSASFFLPVLSRGLSSPIFVFPILCLAVR